MTPAFHNRAAILALGAGSWVRTKSEVENAYVDALPLPSGTTILVDFTFGGAGAGFYGEADINGVLCKTRVDCGQFHLIEIVEAVAQKPLPEGGWDSDVEPPRAFAAE